MNKLNPMDNIDREDKKFAVEKYLDQVKILTALATTLLISPNLFLMLREAIAENSQVMGVWKQAKTFLITANISFLVSIIMTYLIYSSVVGSVDEGEYEIYRPLTRIFSLIQFAGIVVGCAALLVFFLKIF